MKKASANILFLTINMLLASVLIITWLNNSKRDSCALCKDYTGIPLEVLDAEMAKQMSDAYANDAGKSRAGGNTDVEDAKSVWFSLDTLKNFISKIETPLCEKGCNSFSLGVRIYYAKYPDATTMNNHRDLKGLNSDYAGKHTLFIVPTYYNSDSKQHIDFIPSTTTDNCVLMPFKKWFIGHDALSPLILSVTHRANINANTGSSGSVQNHGGLAPPPPGAGVFGN